MLAGGWSHNEWLQLDPPCDENDSKTKGSKGDNQTLFRMMSNARMSALGRGSVSKDEGFQG